MVLLSLHCPGTSRIVLRKCIRIPNLKVKVDMSEPSSPTQTSEQLDDATPEASPAAEPQASYVKLAMRNMVKKRGISLKHFFLTTFALLAVLVGLSYLTR